MDTNVSRNILYTSISNLVPSIFTFGFWILTARVAGAEVIGLTSAISSFVMIIASIDVLDMSLGMKRHLGIAISAGDFGKFKQLLTSTILLVALMVSTSIILLSFPPLQILEVVNIDRQYLWIIIPLIPALAFQYVLSEALIAALLSERLVVPLLIGVMARFPLLILLLLLVSPNIASLLAYSSFLFISTAFYSLYVIKIFKKTHSRSLENFRSNIKQILSAGLASWIPHIISILGSQLAIISVFSLQGSLESGIFYLPMAIFTLTLFIVAGINRVSHPLLAGMSSREEQTGFLSYASKIAFLFTMPIATPLLFFPDKFLSLMGTEFASAGYTLTIFMISVPLSIITEMVYYFVYGRGANRTVLYLGLISNMPRIILYFIMVPVLGSNGAAIAYLVGSIAALASSVLVARSHSLEMHYANYAVLTAIPLAIGFVSWLLSIHFIISSAIIISCSLVGYIRLDLFTDNDMRNAIYTSLPKTTAERMYPILSKLIDRIK